MIADTTSADIRTLAFALDAGRVDLDAGVRVAPGISDAEVALHERNIFLGSSGTIRSIPALHVASERVRASHALSVERLSDERLFYLRSRGLSSETATHLCIEGRIRETYAAGLSESGEHTESLIRQAIRHIIPTAIPFSL